MPVIWSRPSQTTVTAFLVAPLVAVGMGSVVLGPAFILGIMIGALIAYACALILGPPLLLALRTSGAMGWSHFAVGGAASALPVLALYLIPGNTHTELYGPVESAFLLSVGAVGGAVFWFMAVRPERPYRSKVARHCRKRRGRIFAWRSNLFSSRSPHNRTERHACWPGPPLREPRTKYSAGATPRWLRRFGGPARACPLSRSMSGPSLHA